ncbi:MAG: LCP family protein, partial [Microcella sp.]|nr:LCP family protein [Microcella sp.]
KTPPSSRVPLALFVALSIVLGTGTAGYAAYLTGVGRDALGGVFAGGSIEAPIDGRYTILLLGGDAGEDRISLRPDSMTLLSVDAGSGAVTMVGIPRNLYRAPFVEGSPLWQAWPNGFDCGDECLLSYLYPWVEENPGLYPNAVAEGSTPALEAMKDAVGGVTGLTVQYVVLIDMAGFEGLINALGGVVVTVDEPVTLGINDGPVVGRIDAGEQRMDGYTALWYARSRYNLTDYDRMQHQRDIQEAMLRQLDPATVITRFEAIADASSEVARTTIPQAMLGVLTDLAVKSREHEIVRLELVPPLVDHVEPDFASIHKLVLEAVAPRPTPTPAP